MNKLFASFTALLIASEAFAALEVDPVFSSNMVLQQQKPITFFGIADKGASVKSNSMEKLSRQKPVTAANGKPNFLR